MNFSKRRFWKVYCLSHACFPCNPRVCSRNELFKTEVLKSPLLKSRVVHAYSTLESRLNRWHYMFWGPRFWTCVHVVFLHRFPKHSLNTFNPWVPNNFATVWERFEPQTSHQSTAAQSRTRAARNSVWKLTKSAAASKKPKKHLASQPPSHLASLAI